MSVKRLMDNGGLWSPGTAGFRKYEDTGKFNTASARSSLIGQMYADNWPALAESGTAPEFRRGEKGIPLHPVNFRTIFLNNTGAWSQNNAQLRDPVSGVDANPVIPQSPDAARLGLADGDTVHRGVGHGRVKLPLARPAHQARVRRADPRFGRPLAGEASRVTGPETTN
jgi:thiosulfate reductase/polysulfide reductase chain A